MLTRPSADSIILRWAPASFSAWIKGNQFGYTLERYTLVRDNKVLPRPERKQLTSSPIKPRPVNVWESIVQKNKYAAIAAQSLYGDSFQLTTTGTDVFQIVNKVRENEQRFSFALFAADMSSTVSVYLGLRFTDKDVKKGEKYLYRITSITQPANDTLRGSIFSEAEKFELPVPIDFTGEFKGPLVALRWNQAVHHGIYSAYVIEHSFNGKDFKALSEEPLVTLSEEDKPETRYQYATDSLPDTTQDYYYRVRGFSPFGELGPPSEVVKGKGSITFSEPPHITNALSENNKSIKLEWEFDPKFNEGLKGFLVQRTEGPKQKHQTIHKEVLSKQVRAYEDQSAKQTNYYHVVAIALNGEEFRSPVYYAQLIDSIPPVAPIGLKGTVSESGKISLSWSPNKEPDIYGYRIYRGNYRKEEFSQVTVEPISPSSFIDSVNLNTLNRELHYQVMAIDRNQNYSALSEVLTLPLPDKVKPVPPVFYPVTASPEGVSLAWMPSSSEDVDHYDVYQKEGALWTKIGTQIHSSDTIYFFKHSTPPEGKLNIYSVIAVDHAGLESDPATPVSSRKTVNPIKPPVRLKEPAVDRENKKIVLTWNYDQPGVERYHIYRAKEGQPLKLVSSISALTFEDKQINMNSVYTYRVMAVFGTGARSQFSEEFKVSY